MSNELKEREGIHTVLTKRNNVNYSVTGYTRTQLFLNRRGTEEVEIKQNGNNNNNDTKAYVVVV